MRRRRSAFESSWKCPITWSPGPRTSHVSLKIDFSPFERTAPIGWFVVASTTSVVMSIPNICRAPTETSGTRIESSVKMLHRSFSVSIL